MRVKASERHLAPASVRRILVIKHGALGDIVQSFDVFQAIREHHADATVTLLTTPPFADFAWSMPWFDDVWLDDRPRLWRLGAWLRLRRMLLSAGFDRVYDLQNSDRTRTYFRLFPKRRRPEWSGSAPGCSHPLPNFAGRAFHSRDRLAQQVCSAGVADVGPADLTWLDADISQFHLPDRFVLIVPGCSPHLPHKRWPAERYAALAGRLAKRGIASVAVGTSADREAIAGLLRAEPSVIDLCGQTSLAELVGIAHAAIGAVGNDTGPIFLVAAVGAPTLMLMSHHTDPVRAAPWGPCTAWLKRENLDDLTVEEVEAALLLRT